MEKEPDAETIKAVHSQLRRQCQRVDPEQVTKVWDNHVAKASLLDSYAQSMHRLAKGRWCKRAAMEDRRHPDRIEWVVKIIERFYHQQDWIRVFKRLEKKASLSTKFENIPSGQQKLTMLDVGSCFNPFQEFEDLDVTAIDIAPANDSVFQCDFLNVAILKEKIVVRKEGLRKTIVSMPPNHFDVITFCLLLEYLPVSRLRFEACLKAKELLKVNSGLLIIVTPDSCHQARNLHIIRSWKICLSTLGLTRVYYEKLRHVHCMAFLKLDDSFKDFCHFEARREASKMNLDLSEISIQDDLMKIPQDFSNAEQETSDAKTELTTDCQYDFSEFSDLDI